MLGEAATLTAFSRGSAPVQAAPPRFDVATRPMLTPEPSQPSPVNPSVDTQDVRSFFSRVVVISLSRREDRYRAFVERFERSGWPFGGVERFEAVDGRKVPKPDWFRAGPGAWGCLQSHLRILERALMEDWASVLILEDDAAPREGFARDAARFVSELPGDWDQAYLGGQHLHYRSWAATHRPRYVSANVLLARNVNRTHAHAIHRRFMPTVYRHLTDYASHLEHPMFHVDHRLGQLHDTLKHRIYAPRHWLIGQAGGKSDISGKQEEARFFDLAERWLDVPADVRDPDVASIAEAAKGIADAGLRRLLLETLTRVAERGDRPPVIVAVGDVGEPVEAVLGAFASALGGRYAEDERAASADLLVADGATLLGDAAPEARRLVVLAASDEVLKQLREAGYEPLSRTIGEPSHALLERVGG